MARYDPTERPQDLEPEAEHVGSIYWIPGKGDMVVTWHPQFLRDMREQGFTRALVDWAKKLSEQIAKEFSRKTQ